MEQPAEIDGQIYGRDDPTVSCRLAFLVTRLPTIRLNLQYPSKPTPREICIYRLSVSVFLHVLPLLSHRKDIIKPQGTRTQAHNNTCIFHHSIARTQRFFGRLPTRTTTTKAPVRSLNEGHEGHGTPSCVVLVVNLLSDPVQHVPRTG